MKVNSKISSTEIDLRYFKLYYYYFSFNLVGGWGYAVDPDELFDEDTSVAHEHNPRFLCVSDHAV